MQGSFFSARFDIFPFLIKFYHSIKGKFRTVRSGHSLTTEKLVQRIVERRLDYENRNARKEKKEIAAYNALMKHKEKVRREQEEAVADRARQQGQGDQ